MSALLFCGDTSVSVFQNTCLLQYARSLPACHFLWVFNGMCDLACMRLQEGYLGVVCVFSKAVFVLCTRSLHVRKILTLPAEVALWLLAGSAKLLRRGTSLSIFHVPPKLVLKLYLICPVI